ncbi:protein of unknown function [Xenorhabdus poinarii G6]|uniref:Uncharacterized protein n=1 Tax=Xenorhabdus poinarii G6 TaxID=1354304 RepID=A0A068R8Q3_9GAMM|nr:protein of unknown function [Xenorhabdus poinarii G6]
MIFFYQHQWNKRYFLFNYIEITFILFLFLLKIFTVNRTCNGFAV